MKRNHVLRPVLVCLLALGMILGCTACGSSLATNTELYFTNTAAVLNTLFSSGASDSDSDADTVESGSTAQKLDAPTDFTVDADGNYSFTGVDGASYYLLYFCTPDAVNDGDTFIYSSQPINSNDSNAYSGQCANEFQYAYGEYLVKVFAFPELTDADYEMSTAATATYTFTGDLSAPEICYYWNTFDGTMGVQVSNLGTYEYEVYPDQVDITFTNTADSSDTLTLTVSGVTTENYGVKTDALTRGATYEVTAVAYSEDTYVDNGTSETTVVEAELTLGESSLYIDGYSYDDGFANSIFNWPLVSIEFTLEEGGNAGAAGGLRSWSFSCTSTAARDGAAYSYDMDLNASWGLAGTLDLYSDGTFLMEETGGGPVNASTIEGTWVDNGDGTATLSYDHSTIVIN